MGYAKILFIYEDGIRDAERSTESWRKFTPAVGEAVLRACIGQIPEKIELLRLMDVTESVRDQKWESQVERLRSLTKPSSTSSPVFSHTNCVNLCDTVHSTQSELYLWSGNCLRQLYQIDDDDLTTCRKLIEEELDRRKESQT